MNYNREYLEDRLRTMKEGDRFNIDPDILSTAFPVHPWLGIYRTPREHFLSTRIGSAWGSWTCEFSNDGGYWIIGKHKPNPNKRVYCDPDREHWYKKMPNGELIDIRPNDESYRLQCAEATK